MKQSNSIKTSRLFEFALSTAKVTNKNENIETFKIYLNHQQADQEWQHQQDIKNILQFSLFNIIIKRKKKLFNKKKKNNDENKFLINFGLFQDFQDLYVYKKERK